MCPESAPYKEFKSNPLPQSVNDNCIQCGECARQCPTAAINMNDARIVAKEKCICCMRCVNVCPVRARHPAPAFISAVSEKLARYAGRQTERIFWRVKMPSLQAHLAPSPAVCAALGFGKWRLLPKILQTYSRQISSLESNFRLSRLRPDAATRQAGSYDAPWQNARIPGHMEQSPPSVRRPDSLASASAASMRARAWTMLPKGRMPGPASILKPACGASPILITGTLAILASKSLREPAQGNAQRPGR